MGPHNDQIQIYQLSADESNITGQWQDMKLTSKV